MTTDFSWKNHSTMIGLQELLSYVVGITCLIVAAAMFFLGNDPLVKLASLAVLALGVVAVIHHISIVLRMRAIEELRTRFDGFEETLKKLSESK